MAHSFQSDPNDYDPDVLLEEVLANPRIQATLHNHFSKPRPKGTKTLTREDVRSELFA